MLVVKSKLTKHPNASTQTILIPASMVSDSQYPFDKGGQDVLLSIDVKNGRIWIEGAQETQKAQ